MEKSYLYRRHNVYWVRVRVPDKVRDIVGKTLPLEINGLAVVNDILILYISNHIAISQTYKVSDY